MLHLTASSSSWGQSTIMRPRAVGSPANPSAASGGLHRGVWRAVVANGDSFSACWSLVAGLARWRYTVGLSRAICVGWRMMKCCTHQPCIDALAAGGISSETSS